MALALVRCSIEADQGGTPHARARVSLVSWEGRSHALLFMVPLGLPSARPMAQALRLPLEYYIIIIMYNSKFSRTLLLRLHHMSIMAKCCKKEQAAEVTAIKTVERLLSGAVSKVLAQLNDQPLCGSSAILYSASFSGAGVRDRKRDLLESTPDFNCDEEETREKKLKT